MAIKVFDLTTFTGEYDLLEIRFNLLNAYVDKFVICEMMETFSGNPKPLYWIERDKDRFEEWEHKVEYIVPVYGDNSLLLKMMEDRPYVDQPAFKKSFYQKESLRFALNNADDEDIVIYGDADEVIDPGVIEFYKGNPKEERTFKLRQLAYSYWLNNRSQEDWRGTIITRYKNVKRGSLNDMRAYPETILEDGGWHWTNLGGLEAIKRKLESYDHQECNIPWVKDGLEERMIKNVDFLGRGYKMWISEEGLPQYILDNQKRYAHLWKK